MAQSHPPQSFAEPELVAMLRSERASVANRAFEILFGVYVERVVAFAYKYVRSLDVAHDIAQDVFVQIWERRQMLPESGLRAYLFAAVRNRALNIINHETVVAQWAESVQIAYTASEPATAQLQLEAEELSERLRAALASLAPRAREVVMLSREEGLKPAEIAQLLGISPATVYVLLSRSLKQLAEAVR